MGGTGGRAGRDALAQSSAAAAPAHLVDERAAPRHSQRAVLGVERGARGGEEGGRAARQRVVGLRDYDGGQTRAGQRGEVRCIEGGAVARRLEAQRGLQPRQTRGQRARAHAGDEHAQTSAGGDGTLTLQQTEVPKKSETGEVAGQAEHAEEDGRASPPPARGEEEEAQIGMEEAMAPRV